MRFSCVIGGLLTIRSVALATTIESDNFDVASALQDLNVKVTEIPALKSFSEDQSEWRKNGCSVAVSYLYLALLARDNADR